MRLTLIVTLFSLLTATNAKVKVWYSADCSGTETKYDINSDKCRDLEGTQAIGFTKVKRKRAVCLHRFKQSGCMDEGESQDIRLGDDYVVEHSCKSITAPDEGGGWKSYILKTGECSNEAIPA